MKEYIFVLGRDHDLSLLELISYLRVRNISNKIILYKNNILIISLPDLDFASLINDIGGTIKICEVISNNTKTFDNDLNKINFYYTQKKLFFSLNNFNNSQIADKVYNYFKTKFRDEDIKFVSKKLNNYFSPLKQTKNKNYYLLDIVVFSNYIAKTIANSNPSSYKELDKRPENDFLKSISIRLAKIMINLAQATKDKTLLDPFCGVGVILQQAMLMDIDVIGIDNDEKSVFQSKKNLEWTKEKFRCLKNYKIMKGDSTQLNKLLKNNSVDVVVTEPYLGPYLKKTLNKQQALRIKSQLENMYKQFFESLTNIIKENGLIVIVLPIFNTRSNDIISINLKELIKNKYSICKISEFIDLPITYYGLNKKIIRQIVVLKVNNKI